MCLTNPKSWTIATTLGLLAACGGGGGGAPGQPGDGAAPAPSLQGLSDTGHLVRVAQADAAVTITSGSGPLGLAGVHAIALEPESGMLFGLATPGTNAASVLVRIDPTPGAHGLATAPVLVGTGGDAGLPGTLAWHPGEGVLYGVRAPAQLLQPGELLRIDPATGEAEVVGPCAKVTSLTYDPATDALYGVRGGGLYRITPSTGASLELFTDTSELPDVTCLASDPVSGTFEAVAFDPVTDDTPHVVTIDLFGNVDPGPAVGERLLDLEVHPVTGGRLGLGTGGSICALTPAAPAYGVQHLGNTGCDLFDLTRDPADGSFYGIDRTDHLVKFRLDGSCRTIGTVDVPTRKLVYDSADQVLWGIGNEDLFSSPDQYVYAVDRTTAATSTPVLTNLSVGTALAYDATHDAILGLSGANGVLVELDPASGNASLTANGFTVDEVRGLAWDAAAQRVVVAWRSGGSDLMRFHSLDPNVSGSMLLEYVEQVDLLGLVPTGGPDRFVGLGGGGLVEVALDGAPFVRTAGAVRDDYFHATTYVADVARVVGTAHDEVYTLDPLTGETEYLGSTPGGDVATGVTWDPEHDQLGFLVDDEVRWTSPSAPWSSPQQTALGSLNVRHLAFSPERGVFYLQGPDGLHTLARNGSSASIVEVSPAAYAFDLTDLVWRDGALWGATDTQRLVRIDPDTGAATDVGRTRVGLRGLH